MTPRCGGPGGERLCEQVSDGVAARVVPSLLALSHLSHRSVAPSPLGALACTPHHVNSHHSPRHFSCVTLHITHVRARESPTVGWFNTPFRKGRVGVPPYTLRQGGMQTHPTPPGVVHGYPIATGVFHSHPTMPGVFHTYPTLAGVFDSHPTTKGRLVCTPPYSVRLDANTPYTRRGRTNTPLHPTRVGVYCHPSSRSRGLPGGFFKKFSFEKNLGF